MKASTVPARLLLAVKLSLLISIVSIIIPFTAFCESEKLMESKDYAGKDFKKGCITDYKDLVKGDRIDWVWINTDTSLADHSLSITKFENNVDEIRSAQADDIRSIFKEILGKMKGSKGAFTVSMCIYEAQKYSPGKAWIPFAGGQLMQAGIGVEMIVSDKGKTVAKIRHFAREGTRIEDAAQEAADDLKKFIAKH